MANEQKQSKQPAEKSDEAPEPADELTQIKSAVLNLAKTVAETQAKTDARLEELAASLEAHPAQPAAPAPSPGAPLTTLPDGTVRFRTTHKDFRVRRKAGKKVVIDNEVVRTSDEWIAFSQGLYDTKDPEEIEFLRNRPYFGRTLFEDASARPRRGVRVIVGPKSSGSHARAEPRRTLAARIG